MSKNLTGTYLFKDKDPIIDVMRTLVQMFASIEGLSFPAACKIVAENAGIKYPTMYGWFGGPTERPQYCNVARVVLALKHVSRVPVVIGDRRVRAKPQAVKQRRAA